MSARELIVLGTSSQVPTRHRNHNGYFVRFDDQGFIFDPGEGTQRQMILAGVRTSQIHHVCVTHFHGDHCLGLPGLIQRVSLDGIDHTIHVHYPASGEVYWERLRSASIFLDRIDAIAGPIEREGKLWESEKLTLITAPLDHTVPSWGFRIQEADSQRMLPERLAAFGIRGPDIGRLQREGKLSVGERTVELKEVSESRRAQSMAFVMDTGPCDGAIKLAQGADLLVCESTYLESEKAEAAANGHMTAAQAGQLARQAGVRMLVLTHFSQRYTEFERFLEEAGREFSGGVVAARDLDVHAFPERQAS